MEFTFSKEDQAFQQEVRDFIKKELPHTWTGTGLLQEAKDGEERHFYRCEEEGRAYAEQDDAHILDA